MGTEIELHSALEWTELMAQNSWTSALLLGLMQTKLDFFHSRMEPNHLAVGRHLESGDKGTFFYFNSNKSSHYTSSSYVWYPESFSLNPARTPFLPATYCFAFVLERVAKLYSETDFLFASHFLTQVWCENYNNFTSP